MMKLLKDVKQFVIWGMCAMIVAMSPIVATASQPAVSPASKLDVAAEKSVGSRDAPEVSKEDTPPKPPPKPGPRDGGADD